MKLLVIVLCLLSERYLVHAVSNYRFHWFNPYFNAITGKLLKGDVSANSWLVLGLVILPIVIVVWAILAVFSTILFGFIALLLNLFIFYYCLGPENPFYPVSTPDEEANPETASGRYFIKVNHQLFAVIFWFIISGPLGVLFYRLLYLCSYYEMTKPASDKIISLLDWISARITLLLYLLVGNFQQGFKYYTKMFLTSPQNNDVILSEGGLLAARTQQEEIVSLPYAQNLVEHALIVYLVFLAFFTLVAWL